MVDRASQRRPEPAAAFFTREETAEKLRVSVSTVDRLIKSGALRGARIGRRVVVSPQAIRAFRRLVEGAEWGEAS